MEGAAGHFGASGRLGWRIFDRQPCLIGSLYRAEVELDCVLNGASTAPGDVKTMRIKSLLTAVLFGLGLLSVPAQAAVDIQVDLSTQTMHVRSGSGEAYDWPVSTARAGFVTPNGHYGVQSLQAMHYSRKYHNSPMPHSIFFRGGYAIHGTYDTASLGAAASHGCVRLSPQHAAQLYGMVRAEGASISIVGTRSGRGDVQVARRHGNVHVARHRGDDRVYRQVAYDEDGQPVVTHHRRGHDRGAVYARNQGYGGSALGYAARQPRAPSYGAWMENPFATLTGDY